MNHRTFIRIEVLSGVFVAFFLITFLGDKFVYGVANQLAIMHGILSGIASLGMMVIIHLLTRKRIL